MTTHCVESKRLNRLEYHNFLKKVYIQSKKIGNTSIYLSKHPAENNINDHFYINNLKLNSIYMDYPAEIIIANHNIKTIITPINSTIIVCNYLGLLSNITHIISYIPKKTIDWKQRLDLIEKITIKNKINHHVIYYE